MIHTTHYARSVRRPSALALLGAACALALAILGGRALARDPSVKLRPQAQAVEIAAGGTGTLSLHFEMPAGYHVYAENDQEYIPVTFASKDPALTIRERRLPAPRPVLFEGNPKPLPVYEGSFDATLVLAAAADAPPGERRAGFVVGWQSCTDAYCEDAVQVAIEVPVRVLAAGAAPAGGGAEASTPSAASASASAPAATSTSAGTSTGTSAGAGTGTSAAATSEGASAQAATSGWLWQFAAAFLAGLVVTLTPCVYPLIAVTVSYFEQQSGGSRAKATPLALAYGAGIVAMYSVVGVIMASLGLDQGAILGNVYIAWGFVVLFVTFALSMFGLFDIQLPSSIATRLQSGERSGAAGTFVLGLVLGLVAAPCTGPVAGGLALVVAQQGKVLFGLLAFGSLGLGIALPFVCLGIFSGMLSAMPRAGGWMESVKHVFGYVLLGLAIQYIYVATGSAALCFALAGALLLSAGAAASSFASTLSRSFAAASIAAGLYFLFGPYVIAENGPIKSPAALFASRFPWMQDHDAALAKAKAEGKPALVDFSARWCNACHEIDLTTFRDDAVVREMARFVAVKVDVTSDAKNQKLKTEVYKAFKIPFMAFYDSRGRLVTSLPREGSSGITTEDVLATLKEIR